MDEELEVMNDFLFEDSKISVNDVCTQLTKTHLFVGRKAMIVVKSVLKSRNTT